MGKPAYLNLFGDPGLTAALFSLHPPFRKKCRPKTAIIDLNVVVGKKSLLSFFLPLGTLLSFDSFLVTKDDNLNPSLLPFILWENVESVLSKLNAATGEGKNS